MRSLILAQIVFLLFAVQLEAQIHAEWDKMLQKYVSDEGEVDYKQWQYEEARLDAYLKALSRNVPEGESRGNAMAFWINAYNAFTIKLILKNYPIASIMDIAEGKAWDLEWIQLGGQSYTLNEIEHKILRAKYQEPRIHFAVNCAARSCPPLMNRAFIGAKLDEQLEVRTRSFICSMEYNSITSDQIQVSRIFDWYRSDFGDLKEYLSPYFSFQIKSDAQIQFKEYNWELNQK